MPIQSRKLALLRDEYTALFDTCVVRDKHVKVVDDIAAALLATRKRYEDVAKATAVPWYVIAVIHNMECSRRFDQHLHNGDPLTALTKRVPAGRPVKGQPPFNWEDSASDALDYDGLTRWQDWSLPGTLYKLEAYNGFGTRFKQINTPYLWSFSTHYTEGKYVKDGEFSPTAVSKQCGAAVILRRLAELGHVAFPDQTPPPANATPLVVPFSKKAFGDATLTARAIALQTWLNTFPGIFVKVDGIPGPRTAEAYLRVTGNRLPGAP